MNNYLEQHLPDNPDPFCICVLYFNLWQCVFPCNSHTESCAQPPAQPLPHILTCPMPGPITMQKSVSCVYSCLLPTPWCSPPLSTWAITHAHLLDIFSKVSGRGFLLERAMSLCTLLLCNHTTLSPHYEIPLCCAPMPLASVRVWGGSRKGSPALWPHPLSRSRACSSFQRRDSF